MISTVKKAAHNQRKCCALVELALEYQDHAEWVNLQSKHVNTIQESLTTNTKLCNDCLSPNSQFFERTNTLLELVLATSIKLINGLADSNEEGGGARDVRGPSCGEWVLSRDPKWVDVQERLLTLASRIMSYQFPLYGWYKQLQQTPNVFGNRGETIVAGRWFEQIGKAANEAVLANKAGSSPDYSITPFIQNDDQAISRVDDYDSCDMDTPSVQDENDCNTGIQMYCNQVSLTRPLLSRNICFFIDSGGMLSILRMFESAYRRYQRLQSSQLDSFVPSPLPLIAHALMTFLSNSHTWLNEQSLRSFILPIRDPLFGYLRSLRRGEDLRSAFVQRNSYELFIDISNKLCEYLDLDEYDNFRNLELALNCVACELHPVKSKGASLIINRIREYDSIHKSLHANSSSLALANWLSEKKLVELYFLGHLNTEIVRVSNTIILFLVERSALSDSAIDAIWSATRRGICGKQVLEILNGIHDSLSPHHVYRLLSLLTSMSPEQHCEQSLVLAANLTKFRWNAIIKQERLPLRDKREYDESETSSCSSLVATLGDDDEQAQPEQFRRPRSISCEDTISPCAEDVGVSDESDDERDEEDDDSILGPGESCEHSRSVGSVERMENVVNHSALVQSMREFATTSPISPPAIQQATIAPVCTMALPDMRLGHGVALQGPSCELSPNVSPCNSGEDSDADFDSAKYMNKFLLRDSLAMFDTADVSPGGLKRNGSNSETSVKDCQSNNRTRLAVDKKRKRLLCQDVGGEDEQENVTPIVTVQVEEEGEGCNFMNPEVHALWKLLQDDSESQLPAKLHLETEGLLFQLLSAANSDRLLRCHFEACVSNLARHCSLTVSVRIALRILMLAEQAKKKRDILGESPTVYAESTFQIVAKLLNCIVTLSRNHRDHGELRPNLHEQIEACLQFLAFMFSTYTPRSHQLSNVQIIQLWDSMIDFPPAITDLFCDWFSEQYELKTMHAIQPTCLPNIFSSKLITMMPAKITVRLFSLFVKTYHVISAVCAEKPDFQQCSFFAFAVLFENSFNDVAAAAASFISSIYMAAYEQGNFSQCHGLVDACIAKLRSFDCAERSHSVFVPYLRSLNLLHLHLDHFARRFSMLIPYDTIDICNPVNGCDSFVQLHLRVNQTCNFFMRRHPGTRFGRLRADIIDWWRSKMYPNDRNCRIRIGEFRGPSSAEDLTIRDICVGSLIEVDRIEPSSTSDNSIASSSPEMGGGQGGRKLLEGPFGVRNEKPVMGFISEWNVGRPFLEETSSWVVAAMDPSERREMFNKCCLKYTYDQGRDSLVEFARSLLHSRLSDPDDTSRHAYVCAMERIRSIFILMPGRLVLKERTDFDILEGANEMLAQVSKDPFLAWVALNDALGYCYLPASSEPVQTGDSVSLLTPVMFEFNRKTEGSFLSLILRYDIDKIDIDEMRAQCLLAAIRLAMIYDCHIDPTKTPNVDDQASSFNGHANVDGWPLSNADTSRLVLRLTRLQVNIVARLSSQANVGLYISLFRASMVVLHEATWNQTSFLSLSSVEWLHALLVSPLTEAIPFRQEAMVWLYTVFGNLSGGFLGLLRMLSLVVTGCETDNVMTLPDAELVIPSTQTFILLKAILDKHNEIPLDDVNTLLAGVTRLVPSMATSRCDDEWRTAFVSFAFHLVRHQLTGTDLAGALESDHHLMDLSELYGQVMQTLLFPPNCAIEGFSSLLKDSCFELVMELALSSVTRYRQLIRLFDSFQPHSPQHLFSQTEFNEAAVGRISSCGYVGIVNLSATCYLASCIQQLFMIPEFRQAILSTRPEDVASSKHSELFAQLQVMFVHLEHSEQRAFSPASFCKSYIVENQQPVNVCEQRDMTEFFTDILSKVEEMNVELRDLVKSLFVGTMRNHTVPTECDHVSVSDEPFTFIQAAVADIPTLEESLQRSMRPEYLEGDNLYYCNRCQKAVPAKRQMRYLRLPKVLAINTLRYTFNLVSSAREKVNSRFSFPALIDMSPYVSSGTGEGREADSGKCPLWYALIGVTVHTGNSDVGHYYSFIKERTRGRRNDRCGTRWLWFNDTEVKEFDPRRIPNECFGGNMLSFHYDHIAGHISHNPVERVNNAYMLFYERLENSEYREKAANAWLLRDRTSEPTACADLIARVMQENCRLAVRRLMFKNRELSQFVWDTCSSALSNSAAGGADTDGDRSLTASPASPCGGGEEDVDGHMALFNMALSGGGDRNGTDPFGDEDTDIPNSTQMACLSIRFAATFLFDWHIYYAEKQNLFRWLNLLNKHANQNDRAFDNFHIILQLGKLFTSRPWVFNILGRCPDAAVRQMFQGVIILVLMGLIKSCEHETTPGQARPDRNRESAADAEQENQPPISEEHRLRAQEVLHALAAMLLNVVDIDCTHIRLTSSWGHPVVVEPRLPQVFAENNPISPERRSRQFTSYRKAGAPNIDYMCEYMTVVTTVACRMNNITFNRELLTKFIGFLNSSCNLNSLFHSSNRPLGCSDGCSTDISESWPFSSHSSPPLKSSLSPRMDEDIISSVVKTLATLINSCRTAERPSSSNFNIRETDFLALINVLVYMTLCPWGSVCNAHISAVGIHFDYAQNQQNDARLISSLLVKCLRVGACRPVMNRYLIQCIKQLSLCNIGGSSVCPERVSVGCQQLFAVLSDVFNELIPDGIEGNSYVMYVHISDILVEHVISLLRLNSLHCMQFLIEQIRRSSVVQRSLDGSSSRRAASSNANEQRPYPITRWTNEHLGRWVRPLLISHDQIQVRTRARHLLLCCVTAIDELHERPEPLSVSGGPQPAIRTADPVRINRRLPKSAIDSLCVVVKFVYSLLQDIDNELIEGQVSPSRGGMLSRQDNEKVILDEHVDQAFEFLISTLICQETRNLFRQYCGVAWRIYHVSCRDMSQASLANRLIIYSYLYHCIQDCSCNVEIFLEHADSVVDDLIQTPFGLNYDDREILPFNRAYLSVAFGCIYQCARFSAIFRHALVLRQIATWSIKFMHTKGTLYCVVTQQIINLFKLLLNVSPDEAQPVAPAAPIAGEAVGLLKSQIVKAAFENSASKSFLVTAMTVLNLLLHSQLFTVQDIAECILYEHSVPLLSILSDIYQLDKTFSLNALNSVLSVITGNRLPIWPEIESLLLHVRRDFYNDNVLRCASHMLRLYPHVAHTICRNLLSCVVPEHLVRASVNEAVLERDGSAEQKDMSPLYSLVQAICNCARLENSLSKEDRIEVAIHCAHIYPEFLMDCQASELRELDAFYDWMAGVFSTQENSGSIHSKLLDKSPENLKFGDVFLSALESETSMNNGRPGGDVVLLDEQVAEVLLRMLERRCVDQVALSDQLFNRLQRTVETLNSPSMTERLTKIRPTLLDSFDL